MINVSWIDIVVILLMAFGIYAFLASIGFQKRWLTRKTGRTAQDMYDDYADPPGTGRTRPPSGPEDMSS